MTLLGLDLGTTHCKAGLFAGDGTLLALARRPMSTRRHAGGYEYYDPQALWQTAVKTIAEAVAAGKGTAVRGVGVSSMAETGLLLDRQTGLACWQTPLRELQGLS